MREVSVEEFTARLNAEDRRQVAEALAAGQGVARYGTWNLSFGNRHAAITSRFPPSHYGDAELGDFVSATPSPANMRSPLLDAIMGPPQIHRPRVSPSHTEHPSVEIETRVSPHPRGNSGGFINPERLLPGREERVEPPAAMSEEQAWWAKQLG